MIAAVAAGVFQSISEAQDKLCLPFRTYLPEGESAERYDELFALYRKVYFAFGTGGAAATAMGDVLPALRRLAKDAVSAG